MEINLDDDLFYLCSLIEYTARHTTNHRSTIVACMGLEGIKKQLHDAGVNHCLSFEQVCDEITEWYSIKVGDFDPISNCPYSVPDFQSIGRLYSYIILDCAPSHDEDDIVQETMKVFSSFISDAISNFSSDLYYQNPSYLEWSYREGHLLDW